jgi:hypothetical protein
VLYRLSDKKKKFKNPDLIDDFDADVAESINISKTPYIPPAKILALQKLLPP